MFLFWRYCDCTHHADSWRSLCLWRWKENILQCQSYSQKVVGLLRVLSLGIKSWVLNPKSWDTLELWYNLGLLWRGSVCPKIFPQTPCALQNLTLSPLHQKPESWLLIQWSSVSLVLWHDVYGTPSWHCLAQNSYHKCKWLVDTFQLVFHFPSYTYLPPLGERLISPISGAAAISNSIILKS